MTIYEFEQAYMLPCQEAPSVSFTRLNELFDEKYESDTFFRFLFKQGVEGFYALLFPVKQSSDSFVLRVAYLEEAIFFKPYSILSEIGFTEMKVPLPVPAPAINTSALDAYTVTKSVLSSFRHRDVRVEHRKCLKVAGQVQRKGWYFFDAYAGQQGSFRRCESKKQAIWAIDLMTESQASKSRTRVPHL